MDAQITTIEKVKKGEIESGLFHKTAVIKSVCVRHSYEVKHKDTIAVKVCKKCCHVK